MNEAFGLEWKRCYPEGSGSVRGNRDLTGVLSLVAALERRKKERRVTVDGTWESNQIFLGYLLAFMSSLLLRIVLLMLEAGISSDLE